MTEREPVETSNLDRYGNAALPWSRARDLLAAPPKADAPGGDHRSYLATSRPDGRPHAAGIGALWYDGDLYNSSLPREQG
jgi:hypothetical protein